MAMKDNNDHHWVEIRMRITRVLQDEDNPQSFQIIPLIEAPEQLMVMCQDCDLEIHEAIGTPCLARMMESNDG